MKKKFIHCIAALLSASALLFSACGSEDTSATTMHLMKATGTVEVCDAKGKDVAIAEPLKLYSGYQLDTQEESYAWINLDDVKLTKMDAESEVEIRKQGNMLDIHVKSGSLFFHVSEPLKEDESLNIRTSTTSIGIRGTCGWVTVNEHGHLKLYLLEGTVIYTFEDPDTHETQSVEVTAGQIAEPIDVGNGTFEVIIDFPFVIQIPPFVWEEVDGTSLTEELEALGIWADYESDKNSVSGTPADDDNPSDTSGNESSVQESAESSAPVTETEVRVSMPMDASEIFSLLWSQTSPGYTLIVESNGEEYTLDIDYMTIPEGTTLILEEGINVNLVYPEDMMDKSCNLYVSGNMIINGNLTTDDGELLITGGTLQVNGSISIGRNGWFSVDDPMDPIPGSRLVVTDGIYVYGSLDNFGTLEGTVNAESGCMFQQMGEHIGEINYNGGSVYLNN